MSIMKAFTDIEQSKMLAAILPHETSDMYWSRCAITDFGDGELKVSYAAEPCNISQFKHTKDDIPCWSLAALLGVIKPINENTYTIIGTLDGGAIISFDEITNVMYQEEEIIDAVFEMIVWLKEKDRL